MPLYEAVYFCDASQDGRSSSALLRRCLDACIRANVQRALADPYSYIKVWFLSSVDMLVCVCNSLGVVSMCMFEFNVYK